VRRALKQGVGGGRQRMVCTERAWPSGAAWLLADGNWDGQKGEVADGMCNLESRGGRPWVLCPLVIILFQNGERILEG